jgi:hypothetical protein
MYAFSTRALSPPDVPTMTCFVPLLLGAAGACVLDGSVFGAAAGAAHPTAQPTPSPIATVDWTRKSRRVGIRNLLI